jgi:hypothetical protein
MPQTERLLRATIARTVTDVEDAKEAKDPLFEALWEKVVEGWDDEKRHAAILEHALREKMLPDLAGRYKALQDDPDKGEMARKRIDAILAAATQMLFSMKTPRPTKTPSWLFWSALLTCAVMLMYVAYAMLHR